MTPTLKILIIVFSSHCTCVLSISLGHDWLDGSRVMRVFMICMTGITMSGLSRTVRWWISVHPVSLRSLDSYQYHMVRVTTRSQVLERFWLWRCHPGKSELDHEDVWRIESQRIEHILKYDHCSDYGYNNYDALKSLLSGCSMNI